jgi:hypothetical protein
MIGNIREFEGKKVVIVTSNVVRDINCLDKRKSVRFCNIRYDIYSNLPFSKSIVSLILTYFLTCAYVVESDETVQDEQYLAGKTQMNSNGWYDIHRQHKQPIILLLSNRRCYFDSFIH